MSKILVLKDIKLTDLEILADVCRQMGGTILEGRSFKFFSGVAAGTGIQLENWQYPLVIDHNGSILYDNYSGKWGNIEQLHELIDRYQVTRAKKVAEELGCTCGIGQGIESLDNGAIYLEMEVPETCLSY